VVGDGETEMKVTVSRMTGLAIVRGRRDEGEVDEGGSKEVESWEDIGG